MAVNDSRIGDRQTAVATSMRIKLKYPDVETFIQKYAMNISRGGIFIATKQPKAVGTFVRFEFLISDAGQSSIIRGEGQVQWTKEYDAANPGKPHGMGVKFTRLDSESQAVIDQALRWRVDHGTSPGTPLPVPTSSAHTISMADGPPSPAPPLTDEGPTALTALPEAPTALNALPSEAVHHALRQPPAAARAGTEYGGNPAQGEPEPSMAALPLEGRGETRPIAILGDDDGNGRALHESTRPIELPRTRSRAVGDDIDALAAEWGLSDERLARILKRARPRMAEATAELERLLLKPPKAPTPTKAEALAQLAGLLKKKKNGRNGTPSHD